MHQPSPTDRSYRRLFLAYQMALISMGIGAFGIAVFPDGAYALIAIVVGCGSIASAFIGLPKAIVLHMRKSYGDRRTLETANAIGLPLFLAVFYGWTTIGDVRHLAYLAYLLEPRWYNLAEPWMYGAIVLLNLGALAANILSLARERRGPG